MLRPSNRFFIFKHGTLSLNSFLHSQFFFTMDLMDTDMTEASSSSSFSTMQTALPSTEQSKSDLLTHPAVAYANLTRLSDPTQTALLHTVNIYDFDQTLFRSPLPNPALWDPAFVGLLQSWNGVGAGWWHHPASLDGLGEEAEAAAWDGWWNEELVDNIRRSAANTGCLTVLLTGRFGPVHNQQILKMIQAKGLVFDLVATKPTTVAILENYDVHHNQHHLKHNRHQQQHHPRHQNHHQRRQDSFNNRRQGINSSNEASAATTGARIYRKIHTYNTKLDFIYHILFEYPQLQHMHLWDDRPEQISRFHRVGRSWLAPSSDGNSQQRAPRLQTFDITFVKLGPKYLDLDREQDLVELMVKEHNSLVRMEQRGAPSWVAGLGPLPTTRPELERIFSERGSRHNPGGYDFWGPIETYSPPLRSKIELVDLVQTTGVSFAPGVQTFLKGLVPMDVSTPRQPQRLGMVSTSAVAAINLKVNRPVGLVNKDLTSWTIPEELDVPLCLGAAPAAFLKTLGGLGEMVLVEMVAMGEHDSRVWALQVKDAAPSPSVSDSSLSNAPEPATVIRSGRYFDSQASHPAGLDLIDDDEDEESVILVGPTGSVFSSVRAFMAGSPPIRGHVLLRKDDLGSTPYLTLAHMSRGSKPSKASKIKHWEPLQVTTTDVAGQELPLTPGQRIIVVGTIAERRLRGTKAQNFGHLATIARPEVPISQIVKDFMTQQQQPLTGPELGAVIQTVQQAMERLQIPNKADRVEQITALTRSIVYRDLVASKNETKSA